MKEAKTIRISKETYAKLSEVADELQMRLKRPVSLDEAIKYLLSLRKKKQLKITNLAGSWDMRDEEWAEIKASLLKSWERWKDEEDV